MSIEPFPPEPAARPAPFPIPMVSVRDEPRWEYRRIVRNLLGNAIKYAPDGGEIHVLRGNSGALPCAQHIDLAKLKRRPGRLDRHPGNRVSIR